MNIVGIFLNNEFRTGANRRYIELMESLATKGHHVFVIMNTALAYTPHNFNRIDITVHYKRGSFPPASILFRKEIRANIARIISITGEKIDWIHIHGDMHLKSALYLKKHTGARLFYAFRCNDIERAQIVRKSGTLSHRELFVSLLHEQINRLREKQVSRHADLITFQNTADRDQFCLRTGSKTTQTIIIQGNIGLPRCTPEWENKNTSTTLKKLVYVGVLSVSKGLGYLLESLSLLKKAGHTDLSLSILGRIGDDDPVFQKVKELDIVEMVKFEGYANPFPYLAQCDLMVYPTLYDAFPDTVLEALHTGCPVIASATGGLPDLLEYQTLLFESGNIQEIADRIDRCIRDPSFYLQLRTLCAERKNVFNFDWAESFSIAMSNT